MDTPSTFTLPNRDGIAKASGRIFKLLMLGIVGFATYVYLLPFLLGIVWGTVQLLIGAAIAGFLFMVLSNKKFWRALNYFSQLIAEKLLNLAITTDPFMIMQDQIDQAKKDRENLNKNANLLRGQQAKLTQDITDKDKQMKQSAAEVQLLQRKLADPKVQSDADMVENLNLQLEQSGTIYTNSKDYIDSVQPILNSINKMVEFAEKAYRKSGMALENAQAALNIQKDKFNAVTVGSKAMNDAMRAFNGRQDLNDDAQKALDFLRKDIGNKIGAIRGAIQITSQVMDHKDLSDAAKAQSVADEIDKFNIDGKFVYSKTVDAAALPISNNAISSSNKYLDFLKK